MPEAPPSPNATNCDAVPLVRGRREVLVFEDVSEVSFAGVTHDLDAGAIGIRLLLDGAWHPAVESGPAASAVKLRPRVVKRRGTANAAANRCMGRRE